MNVEEIIRYEAHRATRKAWAIDVASITQVISMRMVLLQLRNLS